MRLPAVDGWPWVTTRSLSATGMPRSGGSAASAASALRASRGQPVVGSRGGGTGAGGVESTARR